MESQSDAIEFVDVEEQSLMSYMKKAFNHRTTKDDRDDESVESGSSVAEMSYFSSDYNTTDDAKSLSTIVKNNADNANRGEDGTVKRGKIVVLLLILAAGIVGSSVTAYLVRSDDRASLDRHAQGYGTKIADQSRKAYQRALLSMRTLSRTISACVGTLEGCGDGFPFITVPRFEVHGGEARDLSRANLIIFTPIVRHDQVDAWLNYTQKNQGWIAESLEYEGVSDGLRQPIPSHLHSVQTRVYSSSNRVIDDTDSPLRGYHLPVWQMSSPPKNASIINLDMLATDKELQHDIIDVVKRRQPLLSSARNLQYLSRIARAQGLVQDGADETHHEIRSDQALEAILGMDKLDPIGMFDYPLQAFIIHPVYDGLEGYLDQTRAGTVSIVGFVLAVYEFSAFFRNILPEGVAGMDVVVQDGCGSEFTYRVNGAKAVFIGRGDHHDNAFDKSAVAVDHFTGSTTFSLTQTSRETNECKYTLSVYPSTAFNGVYSSDKLYMYNIVVGVILSFVVALFLVYDCIVISQQEYLTSVTRQTNAILADLFPKGMQRRILEEAERQGKVQDDQVFDQVLGEDEKLLVQEAFKDSHETKALADYFPEATIYFSDIVGFTAWSSSRDPSQVFQLLEAIYNSFDKLAKRRRVFKVETIGDCYVAATGIPEVRKDHAVAMARFARRCLISFNSLVKDLEETLGPGTGELGIRVGINSGPVTAGVLRGDRSRFQLFGEAVKYANRMESKGQPNKILLSQATAELLIQAGKHHWVTPRLDNPLENENGERIPTYWLEKGGQNSTTCTKTSKSTASDSSITSKDLKQDEENDDYLGKQDDEIDSEDNRVSHLSDKTERLVKWSKEVLGASLKSIISQRMDRLMVPDDPDMLRALEQQSRIDARNGKIIFDEVVEVIDLPPRNECSAPNNLPTNPEKVELPASVVSQLLAFVRTIASMYRDCNPFHSFEHASHVAMSTTKLMARIISHERMTGRLKQTSGSSNDESSSSPNSSGSLHDNTYGITSDPLIQFAAVFAALIHDVDHPGVPNTTLVKEGSSLARMYDLKSIAEQNSVNVAWDLFMDPSYEELRRSVYVTKEEFIRFRQLVCNMVMATDIMDKELGAFRKARWDRAFLDAHESHTGTGVPVSFRQTQTDLNRKATIVLEHLIQASDVCHTMQHWHIYIKWNERFFHECYQAFRGGRMDIDPSLNWYKGELGFFDDFIIPLAKKLESCGVLGVSGGEYLSYAMHNREEWASKGEAVVDGYLLHYLHYHHE